MTAYALAAALGFGAVGGVLAGLVGVGGGVILVPYLYVVLDHPVWSGVTLPPDRVTVVAHATSLAVIVPTAASALLRFQRAGLVPWRAVAWMGGGAAFAALVTTRVTPAVPGLWLRAGFAVFLLSVGGRLLLRPTPAPASGRLAADDRPLLGVFGGCVVGVFSALLGVGGGLVAIPLLIFAYRMELKQVAAASMGVVGFAAVAGATGFLAAGAGGPGGWSAVPGAESLVGYVHPWLALALVPGAVVGARLGAGLNQRMSTVQLRRVFAVALLVLGARLAWATATAPGDDVPSAHSGAQTAVVS